MSKISGFLIELEENFDKKYSKDKSIQNLVKKLNSGKSNQEDAFEYAKKVGDLRKIVLHEKIQEDMLVNGYLEYQEAKEMFDTVLFDDYELINQYCKETFTQVNRQNNINLNGVDIDYNQNKTDGIVKTATKDEYLKVRDEVEEAVKTNAKSYYDAAVRQNAKFQYDAGLRPKIIRTTYGKTCKWCQNLAGIYDYSKVSGQGNDVFRRHANCDCLVVYQPQKGKYQDVHSKQWMEDREYKENVVNRINGQYKLARESEDKRVLNLILDNNDTKLQTPSIYGDKLKSFSERGIPLPDNIKNDIKQLEKSAYIEGTKGDFTIQDISVLSREYDVEFAVINVKSKSYLIKGSEFQTKIPQEILQEMMENKGTIEYHSHPFANDIVPSKADRTALKKLKWQENSKIIDESGHICTYSKDGIVEVVL
ncbi:MAG: hypothetical protein KBT03_07610 [Bacteroidales bacterium]|nr:hypothetical protein [Candidatus Scybalousia scybalohippi]